MKKFLPLFLILFLLNGCQGDVAEESVDVDIPNSSHSSEVQTESSTSEAEIVESDLEAAEEEALNELNTLSEEESLTNSDDNIIISSPEPNQTISSPLVIEGEAIGKWYFEGAFLVRLMDEEGKELAIAPVTATEEWMTEEPVPFVADLEFEPGEAAAGKLIFENDNPSGLPENALSFELPVQF